MGEIDRFVGWFRKRVSIQNCEEHYLRFIMLEYAKLYHEEEVEKLKTDKVCHCSQQADGDIVNSQCTGS